MESEEEESLFALDSERQLISDDAVWSSEELQVDHSAEDGQLH